VLRRLPSSNVSAATDAGYAREPEGCQNSSSAEES
jgi:hypothetical protein